MKRYSTLLSILCLLTLGAQSILGAVPQAPPPAEGQQSPLPPPPPPPNEKTYETQTAEQLQRLVAPIALYPDSLLASILAASSFPSEIAAANSWLAPRKNMSQEQLAPEVDKENWDGSVKELLAFPPVLQSMASNLSWTSELGDAYYNQPQDVMNAVQTMRRDAKKHGELKSNDQIKVTDKHGYISIAPAEPKANEVYVPAYNPWVTYGYPIDPWPGWVDVPGVWYGGAGLSFGLGFGLGPFLGFGWGWSAWDLDWFHGGIFFGGRPYWGYGPGFFNRYNYYHGYAGFAHPGFHDPGFNRGFNMPHYSSGLRSGAFSGVDHGGSVRGYSARGQGSAGGGFHGGGFSSGGFHGGGGGGFHGGGGGGFHGGGGGGGHR